MDQELLRKAIRDMEKQIEEQQKIVDRLKNSLVFEEIRQSNVAKSTINYEFAPITECPASKLW